MGYFLNGFRRFCSEEGSEFEDLFKDVSGMEHEIRNEELQTNHPYQRELNQKLLLPFDISMVKKNGNKTYYDFFKHHGHAPFRNPMQGIMQGVLNDDYLIQEKMQNYLAAPSIKTLLEDKNIITLMNMRFYRIIHPQMNVFPFPPILLHTFPDVILWLHGDGAFSRLKTILNNDIYPHLDSEGFIKLDTVVLLVNEFLRQTQLSLECKPEW